MSSIVRGSLRIEKLLDKESILEALNRLGLNYKEVANSIRLSNGLELRKVDEGYILHYSFYEENAFEARKKVNLFVKSLVEMYDTVFKERLEQIMYEELKIKEALAVADIEKQKELKKQEAILRKRRLRLELKKKKEEAERKKQITRKIEELKLRAKQLGYEIKEEVREHEKVLVLVRRR